ncbi:dihydrolipoamide acetyltransferase family protein [Herbiconiux daphne]|uniref:Dihydrolipoamide acetyltransferase component of pyruvate dehydrogenase complex n=1 Tax=Herbiconiux daphne TaxID=2970914 RepID=A0ABT2H5Q8_9MICO|nr:dihydrolipoamide acetyltransferase family protein [Herbiconiux daphne]MCS5735268.1 2-oxo acid dehydrogenase subunit E2 [Herbiconiux daphne]
MSIDVRVPTTGNAGEDAVIVDWNVSVGSQVHAGDVLVTLETAKATIEVEAPAGGEILAIKFEPGDEVPEHEVLAVLGEAGEVLGGSSPGPVSAGPGADADDPGATAPATPTPAVSVQAAAAGEAPTSTFSAETATATATATDAAASASPVARVKASPRARILADRNDVDLATVAGTGPGGRIIIADVLAARTRAQARAESPAPAGETSAGNSFASPGAAAPIAGATTTADPDNAPAISSAANAGAAADFTLVPVRGARKVTAQRMTESLQNSAQVTLTRYADATAMLAYVARLRSVTDDRGLPKIGVNDIVLFATARAVAKHPEANSTFDWDGIRQYHSVDLGFAVDTGAALLVPVIAGADRLSLADLGAAARAAIEKSRAGRLTTAEMSGGTFTVSNLGSLGVHWFTPVLNPPQSCILGVGAAHRTHPDAPSLLPLSLTFDHRALDGAAAAGVLADIARAIETVDVLSAF